MRTPKAPAPSREQEVLQQRQTTELARLDEEENRRIKALTRARIGAGSLLSARRSVPTSSAPARGGESAGTVSQPGEVVKGFLRRYSNK